MARTRFLRWTERLLWWSGALLLGWCAAVVAESRVYQIFAGRSLDRMREDRGENTRPVSPLPGAGGAESAGETASSGGPPAEAPEPAPRAGGLIGRLKVPRIGLSVIVLEGDNSRDLRLGIGHIPGTPFPWESGNAALAGHRDTFLRPLRGVHDGDRVEVATPRETYHYVVDSIRIVSPDDVGVLASTEASSLTLVTCYPFYYVGNAPKRFVVRARRVDG
ncbi:MAG: class D sortase [Thermoanaerobaculia bacterium]